MPACTGGKWLLSEKHYFNQRGANVSSYAYHKATGILAVGFTNGVFDLYQLPDFQNLHTLSLSQERVTALTFNATGDWIAGEGMRALNCGFVSRKIEAEASGSC